jgi:hypothetical protein
MLLVTAPNDAPNEINRLLAENTTPLQTLTQEVNVANRTSPIFVEDYLPGAGGDFRTACRNAYLANPNAGWFIYPTGPFPWVGGPLTLADGYRNNTRHTLQQTEVYKDLAGVASGQQFFWLRTETGATHADNITWDGTGKLSLLNALTSFFGAAVYHESASRCSMRDIELFCSLDPAATQGRIRWGVQFLGGNAGDGGGRQNLVDGLRTTICQIVLCGQGRDADGIICTNIESISNNDFIVSCVAGYVGAASNIRNVTIDNIVGHNVAGGGCVFVGTDGAGVGIGVDVLENVTISNISVDGAKDPDLDFITAAIVLVDLGINSRNVVVSKVNTVLSSTELQCTSVRIQSQDDEVSSVGVSCSDLQLGIVTTNDPLEPLFIQGRNLNGLQLTNVYVHGLRGVRIVDCDRVVCSNVNTTDGGFLVQAESRNLTLFTMANCNVQRTTGFNSAMQFSSAAARSFGQVSLANVSLRDNSGNGGILLSTAAAAGTTRFYLVNCPWNANQPNAASLAAIFRAVNCPGLNVISTVVVPVPLVLAGAVGYAAVAMAAGTRLADLVLNEGVVANPQAQIVAAGVGGGFINARVSAPGTVEFAFLGPVPAGNVDFTVARAAA